MKNIVTTLFACLLVAAPATLVAQSNDTEELKIAALEALISAPPERALPIVQRVLKSDDSDEIKERALFILSQIDLPEAQALLADTARTATGELQFEAIRMPGISGDTAAMAGLSAIYETGNMEVREAVLEAYLIADDSDAVYQIAADTEDPDEFEAAVETLGAMGATEQLRQLRDRTEMSEVLVEAYAIAGDVESLQTLAADASDPEVQLEAISALGMVGGPDVNTTLVEIYRNAASEDTREAALEGMMIAGHDEGVLQLFHESENPAQKRELLEMLVVMDSDAVWDLIDATLDEQQ